MGLNNKKPRKKEKVVFLSHFISRDTPLYGGKKDKINIIPVREIKKGDPCNTLFLEFPGHASTHVDLPSHFLKRGKVLSDYSPRSWLFSDIQLVDLRLNSQRKIGGDLFKGLNRNTDMLLLKTGFEKNRRKSLYYERYPYFSASLAAYLKKKMPSLRAVGIDCISISSPKNRKEGWKAHREFLKRGIIIIEDMRLGSLKKSPDSVVVSPLLIKNADGVPATVFAITSA